MYTRTRVVNYTGDKEEKQLKINFESKEKDKTMIFKARIKWAFKINEEAA